MDKDLTESGKLVKWMLAGEGRKERKAAGVVKSKRFADWHSAIQQGSKAG
jgi:hypothetical protein